jgi:spermidine synthase
MLYIYEFAAHTPLCVLEEAKRVLVLCESVDRALIGEFARHNQPPSVTVFSSRTAAFEAENCDLKSGSIAALIETEERLFDVAIDLRTVKPNRQECIELLGKLTENGIVLKAFSALENEALKAFGGCRYVVPFAFSSFLPLDRSVVGFIFASKKFHPTADLKLQKADMLSNLRYYSAETHIASFTLPPFIYEKFDALKI